MFKRRAPGDGDYTKFDESLFGNLVNSEVIPVANENTDAQSYFRAEERDPYFTDSFTGNPEDVYTPTQATAAQGYSAQPLSGASGYAAPQSAYAAPVQSYAAPHAAPETANYGLAAAKPQVPFTQSNTFAMPLRTSERPKVYALRSNPNVFVYEYTDRLEFYKILSDGVEFYYAKPKE